MFIVPLISPQCPFFFNPSFPLHLTHPKLIFLIFPPWGLSRPPNVFGGTPFSCTAPLRGMSHHLALCRLFHRFSSLGFPSHPRCLTLVSFCFPNCECFFFQRQTYFRFQLFLVFFFALVGSECEFLPWPFAFYPPLLFSSGLLFLRLKLCFCGRSFLLRFFPFLEPAASRWTFCGLFLSFASFFPHPGSVFFLSVCSFLRVRKRFL